MVDWITGRGHKVMLDLKFFDVPETVKLAVRQLSDRNITFTTIHGNDQIVKAAVAAGDLLYGYGQYAKAAELYRAALSKSGADANLINLHLGMALARSGDKAGATAALNAVTGPRVEIAKYWLTYLSTAA